MLTMCWAPSRGLCLMSFIKTTQVPHVNPIEQCGLQMVKIVHSHTSRSTARCLRVVQRVTYVYCAVLPKAESVSCKGFIRFLKVLSSGSESKGVFCSLPEWPLSVFSPVYGARTTGRGMSLLCPHPY